MGKRRDVRNEERWTIVTLRQAGLKVSRIADRLQIPVRTVSRVWRKFQETGNTRKRQRSGWMRKTTARNDRSLRRLCTRQKFESVFVINSEWNRLTGIRTSTKTTMRRLHSMGYYSRVARRKPMISRVNRIRAGTMVYT